MTKGKTKTRRGEGGKKKRKKTQKDFEENGKKGEKSLLAELFCLNFNKISVALEEKALEEKAIKSFGGLTFSLSFGGVFEAKSFVDAFFWGFWVFVALLCGNVVRKSNAIGTVRCEKVQ